MVPNRCTQTSFLFWTLALVFAITPTATDAFVPVSSLTRGQIQPSSCTGGKISAPQTSSRANHPLFLGGLFGGGGNTPKPLEDLGDDRGLLLCDIPLSSMKIGGLRIALSLHCIGQQNNPNKGTWMANQADDGVVEMWYNPDQSGMFSVTLEHGAAGSDEEEEGAAYSSIVFERHGPRPSLVYQLQESLQLHKILDELEELAFGNAEEIDDEDRLLQLSEEDAIQKARDTLPARPA